MYIAVNQVIPGDTIVSDADDVLVTDVEDLPRCDTVDPSTRVSGRIVRGHGRSTRIHSWTYPSNFVVDVVRPEPAPPVTVAEFLYRVGPSLGWKDES